MDNIHATLVSGSISECVRKMSIRGCKSNLLLLKERKYHSIVEEKQSIEPPPPLPPSAARYVTFFRLLPVPCVRCTGVTILPHNSTFAEYGVYMGPKSHFEDNYSFHNTFIMGISSVKRVIDGPGLPKTHSFVTDVVSSATPPDSAASIASERANTNFDVVKMHQFIEGSAAKSEQVLKIYKSLERDPILASLPAHYDLSTKEERELVALRIDRMSQYIESEPAKQFFRRLTLVNIYDSSLGIRITINLGLFLHCIKGNGTAEQFKFWSQTRESGIIKQMYGCFGMTELGHGSNVAGCETTATFDEETDEFIIDTPHIGATKWWIGGAAHSATHSVVYARLIVKGKDYGVKTFIVPLRDSRHCILPGVSIGDIGQKMGRLGVDNGWIQFSDVRIPRFFMLQKWCTVDAKGTVKLPPLEQLSYISLLAGRVGMATDSYRIGARFTTIALRYAVGRRQFKSDNNDAQESKLLDYSLHQRRLLPLLAVTYAMAQGTNRLEEQHEQILDDLDKGIAQNDKDLLNKAILNTKSLFVDSGSLKSTCTWIASDLLSETRQACGGHGYSAYNGFGKTYDDWAVMATWEGDNNVLGMSAGKSMMKHVDLVLNKNKKLDNLSTLKFLNNSKALVASSNVLKTKEDLNNFDKIKLSIETLIVKYCASLLSLLKDNKGNWELIGAQRVELSKLRAHLYMFESFQANLAKLDSSSAMYQHLFTILQLYAVSSVLIAFNSEFLRFEVFNAELSKSINYGFLDTLLMKVRPFAIGLTDSFQQTDNLLNSLIGNYNGKIYENYFNTIQKLNPPSVSKAPYSKKLEDMLNRESLDARDRFEKSPEAAKTLSK